MKFAFAGILGFLSFAGIVCASASEQELLKYVPADPKCVVFANTADIINLPSIQEQLKKPENATSKYTEIEKKLADYKLKISDCFQQVVFFYFNEKLAGFVLKTSMKEDQICEISDLLCDKKDSVIIDQQLIKGKKVYIDNFEDTDLFKNEAIKNNPLLIGLSNHSNATVYLAKDIIISADKNSIVEIYDRLSKGKFSTDSDIGKKFTALPKNAILKGAFNISADSLQEQPGAVPSPMDQLKKISGGAFAVSVSGSDKRDFDSEIKLECSDENTAAALSTQAQGLLLLGSGSAFPSEPALGMELASAIKIHADNKNIVIKISISNALVEKLSAYSKKMQNTAPRGLAPMSIQE